MSALLTQYFENYAEASITRMKEAKWAVAYYERIRARLDNQEDLSGEFAIIGKNGPKGTMTVIRQAIADYKAQVAGAWALIAQLQENGKHKVSLTVKDREHLPRASVDYHFRSNAGLVKIHITTAGENCKVKNHGK